MKKLSSLVCAHQRKVTFFTSLLVTLLSSTSHAQDIEIYNQIFSAQNAAGEVPSGLNPNILFVLDTSGSMDRRTPVRVSSVNNGPYDPDIDYGNDGNAADDELIYVYFANNLTFQGVTIRPDQNRCQAYRDHQIENPENPVFNDSVEQYRSIGGGRFGWRGQPILQRSSATEIVDCEDDTGVHGLTDQSTNLFASNPPFNNTNPTPLYVATATQAQTPFNSFNNALVPGNYHDYLQSLPPGIEIGSSLATACDNLDDGDFVLIDNIQYVCRQRLAVMQEALTASISTIDDVNVGLMRFNRNSLGSNGNISNGTDGGTIIEAVDDINTDSVRTDFLASLNSLQPSGNTPLAESMYCLLYTSPSPRDS